MSNIKTEVERLAALQVRITEAKARIRRTQANIDQLGTRDIHTGLENKLLLSMVDNLEAMEAHYQKTITRLNLLDKLARI